MGYREICGVLERKYFDNKFFQKAPYCVNLDSKHWFWHLLKINPDPVLDLYSWDTAERKKEIFFGSKTTIYSTYPSPSYRRNLRPKREHSTSKHEISQFFLLCGLFLPYWIRIRIQIPNTVPDPRTWLNSDWIRIRIRNTVLLTQDQSLLLNSRCRVAVTWRNLDGRIPMRTFPSHTNRSTNGSRPRPRASSTPSSKPPSKYSKLFSVGPDFR